MMHQFLQRRLHQRFALGVERRCRLVEQQQRRVAQDRTCNGDTLALPSRQRHAAFAELRLESTGQAADEFGGVSKLGGTLDLGVIGIGPAEADVFARGRGEHHGILGHQRDTRTQLARISRSDRNAVERDHTMRGIVEPQEQVKQRAFSCTRGADDRNLLAGAYRQRNAIDRQRIRPRRIGEADVF